MQTRVFTRQPFTAGRCFLAFLMVSFLSTGGGRLQAIEGFSDGLGTPQSISVAPADFGPFGGQLFVPDSGSAQENVGPVAGDSKVWRISPEGGPPTFFATLAEGLGLGFRGGVFLPPDFGDVGGQYLVAGVREMTAFDAEGKPTPFVTALDLIIDGREFFRLTTPVIAPDGFGDLAGDLLVTYQFEHLFDPGGVLAITPEADVTRLANPSVTDFFDPAFRDNVFEPFGLAFAPDEFGQFGGTLLVSDAMSDNIAAIAPDGSFQPFARVPLEPDQHFLRQMAISPEHFGNLGGLLFVSVAGSEQGIGGSGSLHALNAQGDVVASLRASGLDNFDPRGLLFTDDGALLISDAANGILVATPQDFDGFAQLQAGDADRDFDFDQFDLVKVQLAGKYLTGRAATWGEGDWNGAPGGSPASPPSGDGVFDQRDIVAVLAANIYLTGSYLALDPGGRPGDGQTSIGYDATTGALWVDAPSGTELTSVNIDSAARIFTGDPAEHLGGSFDHDGDDNIFKATFGGTFGTLHFGAVAPPGLSEDFLRNDLTVVGSLAGGGGLGDVDLIYVPEPSAWLLAFVGLLLGVGGRRAACSRKRRAVRMTND